MLNRCYPARCLRCVSSFRCLFVWGEAGGFTFPKLNKAAASFRGRPLRFLFVWREAGSFTFAKLGQLKKTWKLTVVMLGGNVKSMRAEHPSNARSPISINLSSPNKSTLTRAHRANALLPTDSNSLSSLKFTEEREEQLLRAALPMVLMPNGSLIDTRALQPWNACFGRCWMPSGRMTFLRARQLKELRSPSSITPEGMSTSTRDVQVLKQHWSRKCV